MSVSLSIGRSRRRRYDSAVGARVHSDWAACMACASASKLIITEPISFPISFHPRAQWRQRLTYFGGWGMSGGRGAGESAGVRVGEMSHPQNKFRILSVEILLQQRDI